MEKIVRNTDILNTGVFVINNDRKEFHPFLDYKNLFITQENNITLKDEIIKIIREAKKVLKICSFIITDKVTYQAILKKAKEDKVAIFIITQLDPSKLENSNLLSDFITEDEFKEKPEQTHLKYINKLYQNGIHVRASLTAHAKFIIADHENGFITSANFTTPSLTFNTESGVYLDKNSSIELDKLFDTIFQKGTDTRQFIDAKKGKIMIIQTQPTLKTEHIQFISLSNLKYTYETLANNLYSEIIKVINDAENFIFLSTYSIVELKNIRELVQAIKDAIARKVSISVFCRGMNYRNDHLSGVSELVEIGCKVYADVYNHSKGVINEKTGLIFTANIDGNHGLTNGFEVGYILSENQRIEFLDFHKKLIETSFYVYNSKPTRNELFQTYIAYEMIKGLNAPLFPQNLMLSFKKEHKINVEELKSNIIFYGRSKDGEFLIVGNSYFKCRIKDNVIQIIEPVKPRFDLEKYVLKFFELKISDNQ
jgi:phosphatidylserine/phosphatidylglycerophosphate/cardiolipin synthase-like enzyme